MIKPLEKSAVLLNPHKMLILFVCVCLSVCLSFFFLTLKAFLVLEILFVVS